jgi:hypothetical protein
MPYSTDSSNGALYFTVPAPSNLPSAPDVGVGTFLVTASPLTLWGYNGSSWVALGTPGSGAPPPDVASEGAAGTVELATESEIEGGSAGVLVASVSRLKSELDRRTPPAASETAAGTVELATAAEVTTGTDTTRAIHPAGLKSAYAPAWIAPTLLASWINHGAPNEVAGYRKLPNGEVQCRGLIKNGTASDGTTLFTLPVGYRPSADRQFGTIQGGNNVARVVVLAASGNVQIFGVTNNAYLSLESIRFDGA